MSHQKIMWELKMLRTGVGHYWIYKKLCSLQYYATANNRIEQKLIDASKPMNTFSTQLLCSNNHVKAMHVDKCRNWTFKTIEMDGQISKTVHWTGKSQPKTSNVNFRPLSSNDRFDPRPSIFDH